MSKLFEVLRKKGVIDLEAIPGNIDSATAPEEEKVNPPTVAASAHAAKPERVASLRVSALAPIFPHAEGALDAAAEQYRIIRTKILHSKINPCVIVVSSASVGDGKTITSINIAASLSLKADQSVLLVDADLHKPKIAELLGIPIAPGLTDVLSGRESFPDALIRTVEFPALRILPAGSDTQNAAELLDTKTWRTLIEQARGQFNNVIIDAPPAGLLADYDLLQNVADGVIIVVRPDHTDRTACMDVLRSIPKEKFLGVVLNCVPDWFLSKSSSYSYYAYAKK